ncbi:MAG: isocitrate/isopropylmalate family dehydrogenase [Thermofilaceae archaeon]|nr:isocitrate/isopropylmalate family dehydrogenase [Thermofilaceae archaeon]MDW8004447.1 isocitrate/isopropylmalate family dehydrogenase [Thermofilaceae archaeon]
MAKRYRIGFVKGDGVGPEIIEAALEVLPHLELDVELVELEAGYRFYEMTGKVVEEGFFEEAKRLDAIIKGPLYTPSHDPSFKSVNVLIRRELDLYANVRPFKSFRGVSLKDFDFVIFRENTEGEYVGVEGMFGDIAVSLRFVSRRGSERISRLAFFYAKARGYKRVTAVHKANILKLSDGLFRQTFFNVAESFPEIVADEVIVDTAAYALVKNPEKFQVLVTPNLYGDILSDLAGGLLGSLGLCGSALIGDVVGVFEPVHGVAYDIAGKGVANPVGMLIALKLMLEYLGQRYGNLETLRKAEVLENSIRRVLEVRRVWTPDLGGQHGTRDVVAAVVEEVSDTLRQTR